jgi:hypothetical protein
MVNFLIDSGAVYSLVPARTLRLDVRAHREVDFSLADGTTIRRQVGDAYFELKGEGGASPVIFGEEGNKPRLGATTLESIGVILDPFKFQCACCSVKQQFNLSMSKASRKFSASIHLRRLRRNFERGVTHTYKFPVPRLTGKVTPVELERGCQRIDLLFERLRNFALATIDPNSA